MIGIHVDSLRRSFGPVRALCGVSLTLAPGCVHGLIGPDGAGKTTLLRLVMGLLRADGGSVRFERGGAGLSLDEARPHLAYMPQSQSLYHDLSVAEHLDFFADLYRLPAAEYAARRARLLQLTRLERFQDRPAGKLSGGMYKKLGLMCALLQSPQALLLDEPTNGVDPISRREFWDLLHEIAGQGVTVALSTAYMDEAERCGLVHVLDAGELIGDGEPREVLAAAGAASFEQLFIRNETRRLEAGVGHA